MRNRRRVRCEAECAFGVALRTERPRLELKADCMRISVPLLRACDRHLGRPPNGRRKNKAHSTKSAATDGVYLLKRACNCDCKTTPPTSANQNRPTVRPESSTASHFHYFHISETAEKETKIVSHIKQYICRIFESPSSRSPSPGRFIVFTHSRLHRRRSAI